MNNTPYQSFAQKLAERAGSQLYRELQLPTGEDFCSNDYLGFAQDAVLQRDIQDHLQRVASGSAGSRLLRGHQSIFNELELSLARFSEKEAALFFPSGYQANIAVLSALLDKQTRVFSDELNHASLIDGIRLSGAEKKIFDHNSLQSLEEQLALETDKKKIIVVESLYSMTGDKAPLVAIFKLAHLYNAQVIVDEAHATGVYGCGLVQKNNLQDQVLASIHSGAKALGVAGSWVACDFPIKDFLINFSRPFIYSTAPSPLVGQALLIALEYWQSVGRERAGLCLEKAKTFAEVLNETVKKSTFSLLGDGPILYLNVVESARALAWSEKLREQEFDIRAIRYPTVAENQAGLRISIHANHADKTLDRLLISLKNMVLPC